MTFDEYQHESRKTAIYPAIEKGFVYPVLGLASEAGELSNKVKKIFRDDGGIISETKRQDIEKELGDVLWYAAQIATEFEFSLDEIAQANLDKLFSRMERNTLHGDGDNR